MMDAGKSTIKLRHILFILISISGEIGDWRNWFTVAENEIFDKIWQDEMKGCTRFTFKYGNDK